MAAKKTNTTLGPKAQLMKKSVDQLKRKAKQLKIQGFSTKKKEQLVNSIMMAEARAKRKPGTKRKKAAPKAAGVKSVTTRVTMKGSGMKRKPMKAARNASRRPSKPMMRGVDYAQFENFGYRELAEAGKILEAYANGKKSVFAYEYFGGPYGIQVGFNDMSGNVFLVDEDYNVLMWDGRELDLFITLPYSGEEGFYDDLMDIKDELDQEDQQYLTDIYAGVYRK